MLPTTAVASRGLDILNVGIVLQLDPPSDPNALSHRRGRTAQTGKPGRATVLPTEEEIEYIGTTSLALLPLERRQRKTLPLLATQGNVTLPKCSKRLRGEGSIGLKIAQSCSAEDLGVDLQNGIVRQSAPR